MRTRCCLALGWAWLVATPLAAQTSYPMVTSTYPVAVPRGATSEVTVHGTYNFYGAYQVLVTGEGLAAEVVSSEVQPDPKRPNKRPSVSNVTLRVTAANDAPLGVRDFRVATPQGVSSIGQLVVVEGQVQREEDLVKQGGQAAPADQGMPLVLPAPETPLHLNGRIESNENIDTFRFTAQAGDEVTFAVLCKRLQDKIHDLQNHADPILFLKDAEGTELAASNNYFYSDPMLHWRFEKSGEYRLQLRDVRYSGDPRWSYVLTITRGPFVLNVFPLAAQRGQKVLLETVGFNTRVPNPAGSAQASALSLPAVTELEISENAPLGAQPVQLTFDRSRTNPVPLLVSELPQLLEVENNDSPAKAQPITLPLGINGRLLAEADVDSFAFSAKKGSRYLFEVIARRLMNTFGWYASEVDSYLSIVDAQGNELAANDDDARGKDSRLEWVAPAEGTYYLQVRDLNFRGGESFVYHLTAQSAQPRFTLRCDGDKAMMGPGSHTVWFVHVRREAGFTGPVKLHVEGLPQGVTATCATIEPHMTQGSVILSAAWDAPIGAANVRVIGTGTSTDAEGKSMTLTALATPLEEIYNPGGGRRIFGVDLHTVSVTDRSDLVQLLPSRHSVRLKPGESVRIDLNFKRRNDYTGPVTIDLALQHLGSVYGNPLPPGVTLDEAASKLRLAPASSEHPQGETRAHLVLKAALDAQSVEDLPIAVMGYVSINFVVKIGYSTPPIYLTVEPKRTASLP